MRSLRLLALCVVVGSGCRTWRATPIAPATEPVTSIGSARIHLKNGERLELRDVRVSGDSVTGMPYGSTATAPRSVARSDVQRMERRGWSAWRTAGLLTFGVAAIFVWAIATMEDPLGY